MNFIWYASRYSRSGGRPEKELWAKIADYPAVPTHNGKKPNRIDIKEAEIKDTKDAASTLAYITDVLAAGVLERGHIRIYGKK